MVADDHPAISLGISYELSQCGSLEMLGQVSNSTELIGRLNEGDCDVVIVDYTMPGGNMAMDWHCCHCCGDVIRICNWLSLPC